MDYGIFEMVRKSQDHLMPIFYRNSILGPNKPGFVLKEAGLSLPTTIDWVAGIVGGMDSRSEKIAPPIVLVLVRLDHRKAYRLLMNGFQSSAWADRVRNSNDPIRIIFSDGHNFLGHKETRNAFPDIYKNIDQCPDECFGYDDPVQAGREFMEYLQNHLPNPEEMFFVMDQQRERDHSNKNNGDDSSYGSSN
jgi:hypothetical protein